MKKRAFDRVTFDLFSYSLAVAMVLSVSIFSFTDERYPLASAETKFVETSESGLSIIPASCPSGANSANCTCNLTLSRRYIGSDDTATLSWTTANGGTIRPLNVNVGRTGSRELSPDVTTTYRLNGSTVGTVGGKDSRTSHTYGYSCAATLNYCNEKRYCSRGDVWRRIATINACTATKVQECPNGCENGACIGEPPVEDECPSGYVRNAEGWCEAELRCSAHSDCGSGFFCSSGMCVYGFPPGGGGERSGSITATPALIRTGKTTLIRWESTGYNACVVTEDNSEIDDSGEGWSETSGEHESSAISRRTQYTLACDDQVVDKVSVNILPVFIEL